MRGKIGLFARPALWSPSALSPLAWYDAQTESTLTKASNLVSQWNDRGTNGNNLTQATSDSRPSYSATGLNSLPAVTSDGNKLMSRNMTGIGSLTDKLAVFAAASVSSTGVGPLASWRDLLGGDDDADPLNAQLIASNSGDADVFAYRNNAFRGTKAVTYDTAHIMGSVFDGTNHTMYIDGVAGTAVASTGNFSTETFTNLAVLGNGNATPSYWHGALGEMIVVIGEVTTANRQRIEGYLAHRWGLTGSLDAGHPYKTSAP
jgi:hypothetical protein